ncbi:hypothetical protein [Roseisalinus antarcticus]|uniref:Restriction endonuclease n=1 Tax=Roseisalinus antarcticus TaxID=254357 RepID=A0A1Y5SWM5_9RHOB|nr:hypothetical protein [Roseisalinus antarcticus]SLN46769.1 hypothetical protein ROA7023_01941 [Roseisalinus antarcticus]
MALRGGDERMVLGRSGWSNRGKICTVGGEGTQDMDRDQFERHLAALCERLTAEVRASAEHHGPAAFEGRVRAVLGALLAGTGHEAAPDIDQGFPDIVVGAFGVEVKATQSDSWRCIAKSVSEGQRALEVDHIYVVYGKFGGRPEVRWADYGASIMHVRTSHVPRFEIEIGTRRPLFDQLGLAYESFRGLPMQDKMPLIRQYARGRLRPGERLWWLEDTDPEEQTHSLPLEVRVYMDLPRDEKRRLRAEAALMCPQVVGGARQRRKYVDAVMYLMTYRGVLCPQARDLYSAGSVGEQGPTDNFVLNSLIDIQHELRQAALHLEDALFLEYWGDCPDPEGRLLEWLRRADGFAQGWTPSGFLFLQEQGKC